MNMGAKRTGKEGPGSGVQFIKDLRGAACKHRHLDVFLGGIWKSYEALREVKTKKELS